MNTGYHLFNQKLARYYTRKQQFTNLVATQQLYQTPIDSVRVEVVTVLVSNTYQPAVKEIRSEYQWRQITSYPMNTNWPAYYFMIGNDTLSLWPIPSQSITNGLRFVYQPQDHDLSIDDVTSTSTGTTVTVTNGSTTVTNSGTSFSTDMAGLNFQVTGQSDLTWYEIISSTSSVITLKTPYIGVSGSGKSWTVGQTYIIPQEYQDAPMHYALSNYWSAEGNEPRSQAHMNTYNTMVQQCLEDYSSSNESNVITGDDDQGLWNVWLVPPPSG